MLFLRQYDISLHLSEKILRTYGEASIRILREDPYRLAAEIHGVGFKSADRIAQNLGIPADSPERLAAGAVYVLNQLARARGPLLFALWGSGSRQPLKCSRRKPTP